MVEFEEQIFTSAHQFLSELRLSNPKWWIHHSDSGIPDPQWQRDWIFRGQSSANWSLLPTSWRKAESHTKTPVDHLKSQIGDSLDFNEKFHEHIWSRRFFSVPKELNDKELEEKMFLLRNAILQAFAEVHVINEFTDLADELGFPVQGLPNWTKRWEFISNYYNICFPDSKTILNRQLNGTYNTPQKDLLEFWKQPTIALAQHHGITTRFLDWTRNPLTALFFASAFVRDEFNGHISVYALHRKMLNEHIRCIEVPSSNNDFLRAQAGLFTVDLNGEEFLLTNGHFPSLEESVQLLKANYKRNLYPKKLSLPISEVPELMRLLWLERVTHAHLMPTLDHVAEAVLTKVRLSENTLTFST